jgi:hypothetical protein
MQTRCVVTERIGTVRYRTHGCFHDDETVFEAVLDGDAVRVGVVLTDHRRRKPPATSVGVVSASAFGDFVERLHTLVAVAKATHGWRSTTYISLSLDVTAGGRLYRSSLENCNAVEPPSPGGVHAEPIETLVRTFVGSLTDGSGVASVLVDRQ